MRLKMQEHNFILSKKNDMCISVKKKKKKYTKPKFLF